MPTKVVRRFKPISWPILNGFSIVLLHSKFFFVHIQTDLFSEIQFLEQNYDIVKCNIWMRQVAEIQNKVKKTGGLLLRFIGLSLFSINCTLRRFVYTSLQCRAIVAEKIVQRFDVVKVPRYRMLNVAVVVNYHSFEVSLCLCVFLCFVCAYIRKHLVCRLLLSSLYSFWVAVTITH